MRLSSNLYHLTMWRILSESMSLMLAAGIGLFVYSKMNRFQRSMLFVLIIWIIAYILSYVVTAYQGSKGLTLNNVPVHNISILLTSSMLSWAGYGLVQHLRLRTVIKLLYAIFIAVFFWCICDKGWFAFARTAFFMECLLVLSIYAFVLYQMLHHQTRNWHLLPEVWISFGLMLYFSCVVPLMSIREYLIKENVQLSRFLFYLINDGFANVMYLFIALGFGLIHIQNKSSQNKTNVE